MCWALCLRPCGAYSHGGADNKLICERICQISVLPPVIVSKNLFLVFIAKLNFLSSLLQWLVFTSLSLTSWGRSGYFKSFLLSLAEHTWPSPISLRHWRDVEVQIWSTESAGHWCCWIHCQPGLQAETFLSGNRLTTLFTCVCFLWTFMSLLFLL